MRTGNRGNAMPASIIRSVACAACLVAVTQASATEQRDAPGLLETMALWLTINFDLPFTTDVPALVSVPAAALISRRYGTEAIVPDGAVVALYDDAEATIFVTEDWTGRTVADLSVLVHELVHHMQAAGGMRFACAGEREVVAYQAQDAWLGIFGKSLESVFDIDPATLLVATACTH
jgi:hypothetical protein